jgi:hypothetical protein
MRWSAAFGRSETTTHRCSSRNSSRDWPEALLSRRRCRRTTEPHRAGCSAGRLGRDDRPRRGRNPPRSGAGGAGTGPPAAGVARRRRSPAGLVRAGCRRGVAAGPGLVLDLRDEELASVPRGRREDDPAPHRAAGEWRDSGATGQETAWANGGGAGGAGKSRGRIRAFGAKTRSGGGGGPGTPRKGTFSQ